MQRKSDWMEVKVPRMERIRAFAFPIRERLLVWTVEGLFRVDLDGDAQVRQIMASKEIEALHHEDGWGDEHAQKLEWDGDQWFFHDADGGDITLADLSTGERLEVATDENALLVLDQANGAELVRIDFPLREWDGTRFAIAGFSVDERYLVVCTDERLRVFKRSPGLPVSEL